MMEKRLLATDFDGTLWRNRTLDPEDLRAIRRWRESGRLFGFVTGRGLDFPGTARELGIPCDFHICNNGVLLLDGSGGRIREVRMDREDYQRLEEAFREYGQAERYSRTEGEKNFFQYTALMPNIEMAVDFSEELNRRFGSRVTAYANGRNINVVKKGESKGQGVCHALEHFGLSREQAAVVGDDLNDLEMLLALDGWAVDTGHPRVLEQAPHICHSVGDLIDRLLAENFGG